jgi:hypothetical protein
MTRYKNIAICLCVIFVSVSNPGGAIAWADDANRDADKPIHLYAVSAFGPIGTVESLREIAINGRTLSGRQMIWGNELLRAPVNTTAQVIVDDVSQITLKQDTIVRLATSRAMLNDDKSHPLLIASLTSGEITVKLDKNASAYVETAGSLVTASTGANFRVATREGKVIVDSASGNVEVSSITSQNAAAKMKYGELRTASVGGFTFVELPPRLDVQARETRNIQTRVTDENDKPIPDIPVIFAVSGKGVGLFPGGSTTFTATTDIQGVANAPFTAGPSPTTGTIDTTADGGRVAQRIEVRVKSKPLARNLLISGAAIGLLTGIIITRDPGSTPPLVQVPPANIP